MHEYAVQQAVSSVLFIRMAEFGAFNAVVLLSLFSCSFFLLTSSCCVHLQPVIRHAIWQLSVLQFSDSCKENHINYLYSLLCVFDSHSMGKSAGEWKGGVMAVANGGKGCGPTFGVSSALLAVSFITDLREFFFRIASKTVGFTSRRYRIVWPSIQPTQHLSGMCSFSPLPQ